MRPHGHRFFALCLVGTAALALALVVTIHAPMNSILYSAAFGLMVMLGLLPIVFRFHGTPYDRVSPVTLFSVTYAFVFTFGSIYQAAGIIPLTRASSTENFPVALLHAGLGLAGFQLGYYFAPWRQRPVQSPAASWDLSRVAFSYWLLVGFVWASRFYLTGLGALSGRAYFLTVRSLSYWELFGLQLTQLVSFGIVPLALLLLKRGRRTGARSLICLGGIVGEFLYWMIASWRSKLLINAVSLAVTYVLLNPQVRIRRVAMVAAVSMFVFLPVIDTMRMFFTRPEEVSGNPMVYIATEVLPRSIGETFKEPGRYEGAIAGVYRDTTTRFNPLDFFSEVIGRVRAKGYMLGQTVVANFWVLVPRIVWPDKPSAIGAKSMIQKWYGLWEEDTMLTLPLELYVNFGPLGVLLGMIAVGLLYRAIFQLSLLRYLGGKGVFLYTVTVILYVFHERELFNATFDFLRVWALFWLIAWWIGRSRRDVWNRTVGSAERPAGSRGRAWA